jgi:hypothetical protein
MKMKLTTSGFLTLLAILVVSSCNTIKEGATNCPTRLIVQTNADANVNYYPATFDRYNIDSITVFVFDQNNKFVTLWGGGAYTSGQDYVVPFELDPGQYKFVAVTNQGGLYKTNYSSADIKQRSLDEVTMMLNLPASKDITTDIADLHLGTLNGIEVAKSISSSTYTIVIYPQTYKVNYTILGLPNTAEYKIDVTQQNFSRKLDNSMTTLADTFHYLRTPAAAGTNKMQTSMTMLNLSADKVMPLNFSCVTNGKDYYSGDLIDMIKKVYSVSGAAVNFNTTFEFDITLSFTANILVAVTVNGWTYYVQAGKL